MVGQRVAHYDVIAHLGDGGMASLVAGATSVSTVRSR
jgi:hypothetical protein